MATAFEQAYLKIRDMITRGDLQAEDLLVPEDLATLCGVSRTPVREALFRLEAEMFVSRLDNKRMIVRAWSSDEIDVFVELRMRIGGFVASRAATRITEVHLAELHTLNDQLEAAIGAGATGASDGEGELSISARFYEILIAAAESDRLSTLSLQLVNPAPLLRLLERHTDQRQADILQTHRELVRAFEARDPRWAEAAMVVLVRKTYRSDVLAKIRKG